MSFPIIYEFGNFGCYATDGRIVLHHNNLNGKLKFSEHVYRSVGKYNFHNVPEDKQKIIKKKFDEMFSDPFTEIEWLKWKSNNSI